MPRPLASCALVALVVAFGSAAGARDLVLTGRYLNVPVKTGAPKQRLEVVVGAEVVRALEVELPPAGGDPDFWVFVDVSSLRGQRAVLRGDAAAAASIEISDALKGREPLYAEARRPQFHFSSRRGRLNDPNGLLYYAGEYHLFYQLHPYGWNSGSKHWGHAISRDLVHWEEQPIALYADASGMMFSGSGVVDWRNTTGFQRGAEPPLVLIYTAAGNPRTQGIAYSNDRGRTWTKYAGNPVLPMIRTGNRDPKVFWHEPTGRWVMALYVGYPGQGPKDAKGKVPPRHTIELWTSPDLKTWTFRSRTPGFHECPDLFELAVDGDPRNRRWILHGGASTYLVGGFDGTTFAPETAILPGHRGNAFYAAQTFSDLQDGRRVQLGWAQMEGEMAKRVFGGMPFNQMMNFPCELSLRSTADGPRLAWRPVREIESLHAKLHPMPAGDLKPGQNPLAGIPVTQLDLILDLELKDAKWVRLRLGWIEFECDVARRELKFSGGKTPVPLVLAGGHLKIRALVDRGLVEAFVDDGLTYVPVAAPEGATGLPAFGLAVEGGVARIVAGEAHELAPIWRRGR